MGVDEVRVVSVVMMATQALTRSRMRPQSLWLPCILSCLRTCSTRWRTRARAAREQLRDRFETLSTLQTNSVSLTWRRKVMALQKVVCQSRLTRAMKMLAIGCQYLTVMLENRLPAPASPKFRATDSCSAFWSTARDTSCGGRVLGACAEASGTSMVGALASRAREPGHSLLHVRQGARACTPAGMIAQCIYRTPQLPTHWGSVPQRASTPQTPRPR